MDNQLRIKANQSFLILSLLIFLFFIFLTILFPYTGDDWAWGSSIGIERLMTCFKNYNGRYLGNLLVMTLTRNVWLKVIVMAFSYYSSCWLCWRYTSSRKNILLLFALVLFLLMPKDIFVQAIVWTAGYANYVPSALICVGYLLVVRSTTGTESPQESKILPVVSFFLGLLGALFIENITIFNICLGLGVVAYTRIKFKRFYLIHITFLIGALLGASVMFTNGAYRSVAAGTDDYRSTADSIQALVIMVAGHAYNMLDTLILSNGIVCTIASALLLFAVQKKRKQSACKSSKRLTETVILNLLSLGTNIFAEIASYFTHYAPNPEDIFGRILIGLQTIMALIYVFSLVGTVLLCVENRTRKFQILFPVFCIPGVVMPLLVVNPIGPRCYFVAYLLMMVFLVDLLDWTLCDIQIKAYNVLFFFLAFSAVVSAAFYVNIYYQIHAYDVKRAEFAKIQSDNGNKIVTICELPYTEYLHCSSPSLEPWSTRYKLFYELENDVTFQFVPYAELDDKIIEYIK